MVVAPSCVACWVKAATGGNRSAGRLSGSLNCLLFAPADAARRPPVGTSRFARAQHEHHDADADRAQAEPARNLDGLALLHRELQRPELGRGAVLVVAEAADQQAGDPGD